MNNKPAWFLLRKSPPEELLFYRVGYRIEPPETFFGGHIHEPCLVEDWKPILTVQNPQDAPSAWIAKYIDDMNKWENLRTITRLILVDCLLRSLNVIDNCVHVRQDLSSSIYMCTKMEVYFEYPMIGGRTCLFSMEASGDKRDPHDPAFLRTRLPHLVPQAIALARSSLSEASPMPVD